MRQRNRGLSRLWTDTLCKEGKTVTSVSVEVKQFLQGKCVIKEQVCLITGPCHVFGQTHCAVTKQNVQSKLIG